MFDAEFIFFINYGDDNTYRSSVGDYKIDVTSKKIIKDRTLKWEDLKPFSGSINIKTEMLDNFINL